MYATSFLLLVSALVTYWAEEMSFVVRFAVDCFPTTAIAAYLGAVLRFGSTQRRKP